MWGSWTGMAFGWMIFGGLIFVAFWVAVVWLIVWAVRRFTEPHGGAGVAGKSPLDIAKDRYARGEITKEQFDQLKKDLS